MSHELDSIRSEKEKFDELIYARSFKLIEKEARSILRKHKRLDEFVMAMGGWFFTANNPEYEISEVFPDRIPAYASSFVEMMNPFSDMDLKVTGEPMRFTADGIVVRDWGATDGMSSLQIAEQYAASLREAGQGMEEKA